jgi:hypothetical protein
MLEAMAAERPLQTKAVEIHRSRRTEEAARAQIVFIGASERPRLEAILDALRETSVLTVSDIPGFAAEGGIVGFVLEDRRVRFEINEQAAQRASLRISSRLLNLARIVGASRPDRDGN